MPTRRERQLCGYDRGVASDSWLSDREQRTWRSFLTVQKRLSGQLNRRLQRESGLSGADYEVLVVLSESPEGRLRAFELGRLTDWEKSRLSHHLSRMEIRGLVARAPCAADPRYADIMLTDAGRAAIEEAAPRHAGHVREWFVDALTPEQLDGLGDACDAILEKLFGTGEPDPCAGPAEPGPDE
jgi:DNA-binding MarR family transcriptional regulator